jgi:hypothetical protein
MTGSAAQPEPGADDTDSGPQIDTAAPEATAEAEASTTAEEETTMDEEPSLPVIVDPAVPDYSGVVVASARTCPLLGR